MTFFSWRFTLIKSPTITVAFVFFFVRWHSSHRIDPLYALCPYVKVEWTFWCTAPLYKFSASGAIGIQVPKGPPSKFFGTVRQTFCDKNRDTSSLVYLSKTQFFSSILKCPRYEIFRDCEKNNFSQKSLYSSVRHVDLKFTTHFLSTYGRVP